MLIVKYLPSKFKVVVVMPFFFFTSGWNWVRSSLQTFVKCIGYVHSYMISESDGKFSAQ